MADTTFRVGVIGTGFMGQAHAFPLSAAGLTIDLPCTFVLDTIAVVTKDAVDAFRLRFGSEHATTDWRGRRTFQIPGRPPHPVACQTRPAFIGRGTLARHP